MNKQITVLDPFRMMASDFFDSRPFRSMISALQDEVAVDVSEDDDHVYVKVSLPGYNKDNVDINVEDMLLTITARSEEKIEEEDKKRKIYRKEISNRSFSQSITLPTKVESSKAKASFKDGILHIELPKAPEVKPKKIEITVE